MSYVTTTNGFGGFGADGTQAALDKTAEGVALSMDPTKGVKYKTAKAAVTWSGQQLNRAVTVFKRTQAGQITFAASNATEAALDIVAKATAGRYSADASGVVDVALDSSKFLDAFAKFGSSIGGTAGAVLQEAAAWGSVAAGCAASVGSGLSAGGGGVVWGAVACGFSVFSKMFSLFSGREYPVTEPNRVPRTLFAPRHTSMPIVAADAMRLAQVLKRTYGIATYAQLANRLANLEKFTWLYGVYPSRPDVTPDGKLGAAEQPLAGHNLRTLLHLLNPQPYAAADAGNMEALRFLAVVRSRDNLERDGHGRAIKGRPLWYRYENDGDISEAAVAHGAYLGRSSVAERASAILPVFFKGSDLAEYGYESGFVKSQTRQADFTAFVILDELINFFGAITVRELSNGAQVADAEGNVSTVRNRLIDDYGLGDDLPLKQIYVRNVGRSGKPDDGPKYETDAQCRTNLQRYPDACGETYRMLAVSPVNRRTLRDIAAVRLCAAFSYIHMQYMWSRKRTVTSDVIKDLAPSNPNDPTDLMRMPVDPRQILPLGGGKYKLRDKASSWRGELYKKVTLDDRDPSRTSVVIASPTHQTPFARTTLSPQELAARITKHEQIVQQAIAKASSPVASQLLAPGPHPGGFVLSPEEVKAFQQQAAKVSSGLSPFQQLVKPIDLVDASGRSLLGRGGSIATPLLVGAAALLALKFLK